MKRTFKNILGLTLLHDYYIDGLTNDFLIVPTAATRHFLKKHRLIFRNTAHGFYMGCDNLTMAMLPRILAGKTLSFVVKLRNTDFLNFTELLSKSGSKDIYYLHSQSKSEELTQEVVALYPPVFTHQFLAINENTKLLRVEDPEGNMRIEKTFTPEYVDQKLSASINLEGHFSGLYRFIVIDKPDENTENIEKTESIYITYESPAKDIFGLVEITLPDFSAFVPDTYEASQYQYQFNTKASLWEYHLLFSKDYGDHSFEIKKTDEEGIIFKEVAPVPDYVKGNRSVFVSHAVEMDQDGEPVLDDNDEPVLAPALIPYREAAKKE